MFEQIKINKSIEANLDEKEKRGLDLINKLAPYAWGKNLDMDRGNINWLPSSSPRPNPPVGMNGMSEKPPEKPEYHPSYVLMMDFLNNYPEYKTRNANRIRKWYDM
jgi:hypothetical protein